MLSGHQGNTWMMLKLLNVFVFRVFLVESEVDFLKTCRSTGEQGGGVLSGRESC